MADGALPFVVVVYDNFAVKPAHVAVVAFSVEFGVLDIIVNEFDYVLYRRKVMTHIGYFDVGNGAARRNLLELAFEHEFRECVNILAYVDVVTV